VYKYAEVYCIMKNNIALFNFGNNLLLQISFLIALRLITSTKINLMTVGI